MTISLESTIACSHSPNKWYAQRSGSACSSGTTSSTASSTATNVSVSWLETTERHIRDTLASDKYDRNHPLLVGICGCPGSGKSLSSGLLQQAMADLGCLILPMDGYHRPRGGLSADQAWRRGAPDTFDAQRCIHDLQRIRFGREPSISLPGFDHADGDPRSDQHVFVRGQHQVVLVEGLYVLHTEHGFAPLTVALPEPLLDWTLFIDVPLDVCMERIQRRNVCIPGYTAETVARRVTAVDRVNAELVKSTRDRANVIVGMQDLQESMAARP